MIRIDFLADHPGLVHTLAEWFRIEWAAYYEGQTLEDVKLELAEGTNRECLPVRLVALENGNLAGTIILRDLADPSDPASSPGLGGLLVHSDYRRRGIGTMLIEAGTHLAADQGYSFVFATSGPASGMLMRLGWLRLRTVVYGDEVPGLWRKVIEKSGG
jgi:GNAT superfamily N-acetyltransferase